MTTCYTYDSTTKRLTAAKAALGVTDEQVEAILAAAAE